MLSKVLVHLAFIWKIEISSDIIYLIVSLEGLTKTIFEKHLDQHKARQVITFCNYHQLELIRTTTHQSQAVTCSQGVIHVKKETNYCSVSSSPSNTGVPFSPLSTK